MRGDWRGCFTIPMTPFDENDCIDEDVLRAEIEYCIQCSVAGLVTPVLVSEFQALSEDERRIMMRVPVQVAAGRVPVVVNVAAVNAPLAVSYAQYAREIGADAVIAMPPYALRPDYETIHAYYQAIADAAGIPVWIQNTGLVSLSTDQIDSLCSQIAHVSWIKEEVEPSPRMIANLMSRKNLCIKGVMGGAGGRYMITEHARGSKGIVNACEVCDLTQQIWTLLDQDQSDAAGVLFERVAPVLILEGLMGMAFAKEIMVRRGIFKNHHMRMQAHPLDKDDMHEIDRVWDRIQPYLIWHKS